MLPIRVARAAAANTASGPPSSIRIAAPRGPVREPALSNMPDTTFAAVRSSGEAATSGRRDACNGRESETDVAVIVART